MCWTFDLIAVSVWMLLQFYLVFHNAQKAPLLLVDMRNSTIRFINNVKLLALATLLLVLKYLNSSPTDKRGLDLLEKCMFTDNDICFDHTYSSSLADSEIIKDFITRLLRHTFVIRRTIIKIPNPLHVEVHMSDKRMYRQ